MRAFFLSVVLLFVLSACTPVVPDANRLLLFESEQGTHMVDFSDFAREQLYPDFGSIQSVSPDGSAVAAVRYDSERNKHTLVVVDLHSREETVIAYADDFDADFLSHGRLFYQRWDADVRKFTYWISDTATGTSVQFDVLQCHEPDANPVYDYVACINGFWGSSTSHAEFNPGVAVYNLDGTVHYRLTTDDARSPYAWSADGGTLAYGVPVGDGLFELWTVGMVDIRSARKIMGVTDFAWAGITFNPDGSKIAFGYNEPGDEDQIGIVDVQTGDVATIAHGEEVIWLADTTIAVVRMGWVNETLQLIDTDHPILSQQRIYGGIERFNIFAVPYAPED